MTGWFSQTLYIRYVLIVAMLGAMGCSGSLFKNKDLQKLKDQMRENYATQEVFSTYNGKKGEEKEAYRREVVVAWLSIVDAEYNSYELDLSKARRGTNAVSDVTVLGLSTAATISGGEQAKTVLAGMAALITGARAVVDKELFYDQSLPVLMSRMRILREQKKLEILANVEGPNQLPVETYTLMHAWQDVLDYEQMGTLTTTIMNIAEETEKIRVANKQARTAK